jgi:hypothetical protein
MVIKNEDDFYNEFTPVKNHIDINASFDGCLFETYGPELDFVKSKINENKVVTIMDCDGVLYLGSGFHSVNRLGYLILDKPYKEDFDIKFE